MNAELLKESFDLIAPRKDEFAHSFYERLFADYPQTRFLFAADISRQEKVLMATLATVVAGVQRGENLVPALQGLGSRHKGYGAVAGHYPAVGATLLATMREYLGPHFTPEVENAWTEAYNVISSQMLIGAETLSR